MECNFSCGDFFVWLGYVHLLLVILFDVYTITACYGIMSATPVPWMCARCTSNVVEAECCLCSLRGGALKPTTDGRCVPCVCACAVCVCARGV